MLAYLSTKEQFLKDAPIIEDLIKDSVLKNFNFAAPVTEINAWRNSLGNAMFHVLNNSKIPNEAEVAVEYRLNGRRFRLDFVLAGADKNGKPAISIVELKQWSEIVESDLLEHVKTALGGGLVDTTHPSYQAWSYKSHLENFNEFIYENQISVEACAYLHNLKDEKLIRSSQYEEALSQAPVFVHGEIEGLRKRLENQVVSKYEKSVMKLVDESPIRPSKQLADSVGNMLKGINEYVLLDEQKTVFEKIIQKSKLKNKSVLIIKGGPGTGKSVIAINALSAIIASRMSSKYITANAAPRTVFESKLKNLIKGDTIKHLFGGSGSYTESKTNDYDVLIVDEAHRLRMKSGMFKNLGEDQAKEIINAARLSVFFIDEAQKVTWSDVGEISKIKSLAAEMGADVEICELVSQFRCSGSDDYMVWLDEVLGIGKDSESYFTTSNFDFKIFDTPTQLHEEIRSKNSINNKSRVVAGYCWDWVSKKSKNSYDIELESGYKAKWNLIDYGNEWIMNPNSIDEVGCIHTCQGLEVEYVGVIVGKDLIYRNGHLITDPNARAKTDKSLAGFKKEFKENPFEASTKADELIRNTYRTLMSRGMKGCYVYFEDKQTADFIKSKLPN